MQDGLQKAVQKVVKTGSPFSLQIEFPISYAAKTCFSINESTLGSMREQMRSGSVESRSQTPQHFNSAIRLLLGQPPSPSYEKLSSHRLKNPVAYYPSEVAVIEERDFRKGRARRLLCTGFSDHTTNRGTPNIHDYCSLKPVIP